MLLGHIKHVQDLRRISLENPQEAVLPIHVFSSPDKGRTPSKGHLPGGSNSRQAPCLQPVARPLEPPSAGTPRAAPGFCPAARLRGGWHLD